MNTLDYYKLWDGTAQTCLLASVYKPPLPLAFLSPHSFFNLLNRLKHTHTHTCTCTCEQTHTSSNSKHAFLTINQFWNFETTTIDYYHDHEAPIENSSPETYKVLSDQR